MPFLTFNLAYPLPAECEPQRVLDALHRYEPLITPNPYLISFRRRAVDLAEIVDDPFFREDGQSLAAFEIVDRIVLVPGVATKQVVVPCVMQRFAGGVRCRSLAPGGVRVWSTWRVLPAGQVTTESTSSKRSSMRTSRDEGRRSRSNSPSQPPQAPVAAAAPLAAAASSQALTPSATPPTANGNNPASSTAAIVFPESGEGYEIVEEARVECGSLVKPFVGRSFREGHIEILRQVVEGVIAEAKQAKMSYVYM